MTGSWRTRSTNNSISNSSSRDLLFVSFVLFSSSSLVFSLPGLLLNSSSCSRPAVNVSAWISCSEATTRDFLWKKVGLQNTSVRLPLLLLLQIPYSKVRKSWINFTCVSLREAMLKNAVDIKTKSDWLLKFQLKKSSKNVENNQLFFPPSFHVLFSDIAQCV